MKPRACALLAALFHRKTGLAPRGQRAFQVKDLRHAYLLQDLIPDPCART